MGFEMSTPKPPEPRYTVLPYMGKPKEEVERAQKRKKFKNTRVTCDGTRRTPAMITPEWRE